MIPAHLGGASLPSSPGGTSALSEGLGGSHAHHKSLLKLEERSLCVQQGLQLHLLIRKLVAVYSGHYREYNHELLPTMWEMSHSRRSLPEGTDGALTLRDLGGYSLGLEHRVWPVNTSSLCPVLCFGNANL